MEHPATSPSIGAVRERRGEIAHIEPISPAALRAWFDSAAGSGRQRAAQMLKRLLDLVGSALAIVLVAPLLVILVLVNAAATRGNPIFIQRRVGRYGAPFSLVKLRTMAIDADERLRAELERDHRKAEEWHRTRKLREDPRVTRVGRGPAAIQPRRAPAVPQRARGTHESRRTAPDRHLGDAALR